MDLVSPYIILYYIEEYRTGVDLVSPGLVYMTEELTARYPGLMM